jgi:hypothetical protein
MLSSYPEIDIELHTREDANDGIKSVKSRGYERHTAGLPDVYHLIWELVAAEKYNQSHFVFGVELNFCCVENRADADDSRRQRVAGVERRKSVRIK